jgi:3-ketosteroid 9alpha-monooxygenase subunit B
LEKEEKPVSPGAPYALRVSSVIRETADACSLVLDVPDGLKGIFRYEAGQFLTLQVPFEGKTLSRCYSLSSAPACDLEFKVTVKRVADGRISNWINDRVRDGDTIMCLPPGGRFTLNGDSNDLVLFAAGSGITPVISLIKSALVSTERRVKLMYANRDPGSVIFRDSLEQLVTAYPGRCEVIYRFDDRDGYIHARDIALWVEGLEAAEFYVCGPAPFMNVVERSLLESRIPEAHIHIERFVSPPDPDEHADAPEQPGSSAGEGRLSVSLEGNVYDVPYQPGQTVLSASQGAGLRPPFSCTDGFCGCCMAKVTRGSVRMIQNDFLSKKEVEQGWVLTCQAIPTTPDVEVRYPD